jgi:aldose 1-epimerase
MADGRPVQKITLQDGGLCASVLTWGAVLQSVRLDGVAHGLTLGSPQLSDYEGDMRHHGSLIGPVVNRITGARAMIGGTEHVFDANQEGQITLHSGRAGTHLKIWRLAELSETSATLTLELPDGEGGFPGHRRLAARFTVLPPGMLRLEVTASTDAPTLMNIANHSYWNLDGSAEWSGHRLMVLADHYLPTTPHFTPTGQIAPVTQGGMDFRTAREIIAGRDLFDTNFCLAPARRTLTDALHLVGRSGVSMTVATTEPGIQIYDGRNAFRPGRGPHEGLAIETQFWPDAPNNPGFPDILLQPEDQWRQVTEWRFSKA